MATLFPSLRHLEAACFLCGPIVSSTLADQLESLTVTDRSYESSGPNLETVAQAARTLPKLKKIVLYAEQHDTIEVEPIKNLVRSAPVLEELEFRLPLDKPVSFLAMP